MMKPNALVHNAECRSICLPIANCQAHQFWHIVPQVMELALHEDVRLFIEHHVNHSVSL